jgi:dienelactone hydrolase
MINRSHPLLQWTLRAILAGVFSTTGLVPRAAWAQNDRLRIIIETDAGGDPDDEQSLVRFLLYVNEWDVEGIIANRPRARDRENLNPERTGLGVTLALVNAYGQCYPSLVRHDPYYPKPEQLRQRTVAGYANTEDGVNLIVAAVDKDDPRPVWFCNWGTDHGAAPSCLKRALDRVLRERGKAGYAKFKNKLRLSSDNQFGDHTSKLAPPWKIWVDTFRPELEGRRWYHRFSALTARAGGFDLERDARTGHGPLGALYPTNTTHWQKEGDTMTFLYLIPTGLSDPEQPGWGSWAGRYGLRDDFPGKPYYWANQADAWWGATHRDNTVKRWAAALQNDFKARLNWCVKPFQEANHLPRVVLNGIEGQEILRLTAEADSKLEFDAGASTDPDGQPLHFDWFVYPEAGTYRGPVSLNGTNATRLTVQVPQDAAGRSIHLVVAVTDTGEPPLTRYRRAVIRVDNAASAWRTIKPFFQLPAEFAGQFGSYRSPLLFDDGTMAKSAADWPRRRGEILKEWRDLMGPWPPIIEKPKMEILSHRRQDNFTRQRVRVDIAPDQTGEGWLLVPEGSGPFPAVLVVYYEPETSIGIGKEPLRDFGSQLARRGFVTLSIGTPGGNAWRPELGGAVCQPLSFHAYVAANCWQALAHLPEVDRARIGVIGHSYGGKWAMFAGALWDKFACVVASDPGIVFDETRPNVNYWEPWYLGLDPDQKRPRAGLPTPDNPRTGAYRRMIETGRDLHELHALIAPRPFLVSGGSEDPPSRWLALNHLVAVNRLLGRTNRVALTSRPAHSPTEESNGQIYAFFEHFLKYGGRGL